MSAGYLENERKDVLKGMEDPYFRERSVLPSGLKSHSRGRSHEDGRLVSRPRRTKNGIKWSILNHDPSERLTSKAPDDDEELASEEEQISDTDNEFQYDDGGTILPNFATYRKVDDGDEKEEEEVEKPADAGVTAAVSAALEITTNKIKGLKVSDSDKKEVRIVREAHEIAKLQELEAAQSALENAVAVGTPIPPETIATIKGLLPKEKEYIDIPLLEGTAEDGKKALKKVSELNLRKYATYKNQITSGAPERGFNAPYTYDSEFEEDIELAKQLNKKIKVDEIDSSRETSRCIRTITRGDFFEHLTVNKRPNTFLVCMDFSPESNYALEWCIGTVLSNDSVLFMVCVIDEDKDKSINKELNSAEEAEKEKARKDAVERLTQTYLSLIKLTKLQIHAVIEVIHHPIPRHLITEIIDHIQPTLVVVGSRGKSALQGVLLGSLSNYLVTKSSVPVMVVRKELKKTLKKKKFSNNIGLIHSLKEARVD